jgi:hypothetical protein
MMAIITNEFEQFVGRFIRRRFPVGHIPQWVRDALLMAGISLSIIILSSK